MNITNNPEVMALLNGVGKSAPEMTRNLSVLGDGSMAEGLIALWKNGQENGIVKGTVVTSLVFTVGIGLYALAKNKLAELNVERAIRVENKPKETDETSYDMAIADKQCEATLVSNNVEVTA